MPTNLQQPTHQPILDDDENDIGEFKRTWKSEYGRQAKYAAGLQTVAVLGRRPCDWAKRELLAGASGDDPRNWFIRAVLKNDPTFLKQPWDCIKDSDDYKVIREARAFDYMSRHHLYRLVDELACNSTPWKAAAAAAVCPTSLYATNERIPHKFVQVRKGQVCQNHWCCPHCYARLVVDQLNRASLWLQDKVIEFVTVCSTFEDVNLGNEKRVKSLRHELRGELIEFARSAGGVGGLWTQQISPALKNHNNLEGDSGATAVTEGFSLKVSVLAVIPRTVDSLRRLQKLDERNTPGLRPVEIDVLRYDPLRTLRACFIKARNSSSAAVKLTQNPYGLFYWPPMSLCSSDEWKRRFELLRYQPVFGRWGSWSQYVGPGGTAGPSVAPQSSSGVSSGKSNLLQLAEPILLKLGFPRNPLPGRKRLREALENDGVSISERQVRWLISHLVNEG